MRKVIAKISLLILIVIVWAEYHVRRIRKSLASRLTKEEKDYLDETNLFI